MQLDDLILELLGIGGHMKHLPVALQTTVTVSVRSGEVHLGPGWWAITAREDTALVPDRQREALVSVEQPLAPTEVEHGGVGAEDGGDEAGVARQPAYL